jgi:beta-phosphoglucomutase-like phosphatase (HAD superfamily)
MGAYIKRQSLKERRSTGPGNRCRDLGIDPNDVVVIGDSDADIGAAAASVTGMRVALAGPPQSARRTISSKLPVARPLA